MPRNHLLVLLLAIPAPLVADQDRPLLSLASNSTGQAPAQLASWVALDQRLVAAQDPGARLGSKKRWAGRLHGDRRDQDCTLVVLRRTANSLTFRLENERGGWFRFECAVKGGKVTVVKITHTRDAQHGARAIIDQEKGTGRFSSKAFVLHYAFRSQHKGHTGKVTGKIKILLD